jgi:hypothetical protein
MATPIVTRALSAAKPAAKDLLFNFWNRVVKSGWAALESQGQYGKLAVQTLREQSTAEGIMAGEGVSLMKQVWDSVPVVQRTALPQNHPSWQTTRQLISHDINELSARGARVVFQGQRVPIFLPQNWMPKVLKDSVIESQSQKEALADYLVTSQQIPDKATAMQAIIKIGGQQYGRYGYAVMFDNLGYRMPAWALETDPALIASAWHNSTARFATKMDFFGKRDVNLRTLIDLIGRDTQSHNAKMLAKDVMDSHEYGYAHLGGRKYYEGKSRIEGFIRSFEGLTKLGRVAIAEPTQAFNALVLTDAKSFFKSVEDIASNRQASVEFAIKSGALLSESIRDFKNVVHGRFGQGDAWGGALSSMLHYTGFDYARKMNVILSANAGKNYAIELAGKLVHNSADKEANIMLKTLGIEPTAVLRQGGLTVQDTLIAGRRAAEMTQFFRNPADLPIFWGRNPTTRTASLYKNYIFNQAKFTKDILFKKSFEAGKYQNFAYLAILFPVVGELVGDLESLARGESPNARMEYAVGTKLGLEPDNVLNRYFDNLSRVGHIGMFYSLMAAFNRNNVSNWLGGPVAGDVDDLVRVGNYLVKGEFGKAGKTLSRKVPVVGPAIKTAVYGEE